MTSAETSSRHVPVTDQQDKIFSCGTAPRAVEGSGLYAKDESAHDPSTEYDGANDAAALIGEAGKRGRSTAFLLRQSPACLVGVLDTGPCPRRTNREFYGCLVYEHVEGVVGSVPRQRRYESVDVWVAVSGITAPPLPQAVLAKP